MYSLHSHKRGKGLNTFSNKYYRYLYKGGHKKYSKLPVIYDAEVIDILEKLKK